MSTDAKTLDFARGCISIQNQLVNFLPRLVRDREVGGSNPLAPTNNINDLRLPAVGVLVFIFFFVLLV
jgi:hypothetical protein